MKRWLRTPDWMSHDRQIDGTILRDDLIEPYFWIIVGIPAGSDILRAARRRHENAVNAERLAVFCSIDLFVGGHSPSAGNNRKFAVRFFHCNFEHSPFLLARQVKYLARLRVDAEPTSCTHKFFVLDEILQKASIRRLVNFHMLIERQQRCDVKMVSNGLLNGLHGGSP